jgi:hypothetical protein
VSSPGRWVVLVSGAPGSGKTTLAVPLAAELGLPLLRKDRIKETLHDALGAPAPGLAWSNPCHPVHVVTRLTPGMLAEYDRPVGIGEVITVDTTVPVDTVVLAGRVRASLRPAAS